MNSNSDARQMLLCSIMGPGYVKYSVSPKSFTMVGGREQRFRRNPGDFTPAGKVSKLLGRFCSDPIDWFRSNPTVQI